MINPPQSNIRVAIIIPIYNALPEARACIASLLKSNNKVSLEIFIIEDCSSDKQVKPFLQSLEEEYQQVHCFYHKENKGFVATINEGLRLSGSLDVILLNSDTIVSNHWVDRLHSAAYSQKDVATVTPFSNNASLCSFPKSDCFNPLPEDKSGAIDKVFSIINAGKTLEIPTGVGFCMYIRRKIIEVIGTFSETHFGKGYGEENDFCFRAKEQKWHNLLCADTYVFHHGGRSFTKEKAHRIALAMKQLDLLHPSYHSTVHQFLENDPIASLRIPVSLALQAKSANPVVLLIRHNRGGGTLKHVNDLKQRYRNEISPLELYPLSDNEVGFKLNQFHCILTFKIPDQLPSLIGLCHLLRIDYVHIHHLLGLPIELLKLPQKLQVNYDITLHDYFFLEGNPCLTNTAGRYSGDSSRSPLTVRLPNELPGDVTLASWRRETLSLLQNATRIISPSYQASQIYSSHFGPLALTTTPHPDTETAHPYPSPYLPPHTREFKVVIVGALSKEKGADLLEATALYYSHKVNRENIQPQEVPIKFYLIGYAYRTLSSSVIVLGEYNDIELSQKLEELQPNLVWFPAMWPETYSYTLSSCLSLGLPVLAPSIGAFPERLSGRPLSWIYRWNVSAPKIIAIITHIKDSLDRDQRNSCAFEPPVSSAPQRSLAWHQASSTPTFYCNHYLSGMPAREIPSNNHLIESRLRFHRYARFNINSRQILWAKSTLGILRYLRGSRFTYRFARIIPETWQRRIKNNLERTNA